MIVSKLLPYCYLIVTSVTGIVIQLCYIFLRTKNRKRIRMITEINNTGARVECLSRAKGGTTMSTDI